MVLTLLGALTSCLTAGILAVVEIKFGFAFYSWMFWFIIPVGAVLSGFMASSGYYMGARLFNRKPSRILLLNILAISLATYFLLHWLEYISFTVDGVAVSQYIPFWKYLDIAIRSASMSFSFHGREMGATGTLGNWGYAVALLQVGGFAFGGFAVYGWLSSLVYCDRCARYYSNQGKQVRYFNDADELSQHYEKIAALISEGSCQQALAEHAATGRQKRGKGDRLMSTIAVKYCRSCQDRHLTHALSKLKGNNWEEIAATKQTGLSPGPLELSR